MRLRSIISIAGALLFAAAALAEAPAGWKDVGNTLVHDTGAKCPAELDNLKRTRVEPAVDATLGVCVYGDDNDVQGLIRVRRYVAGAGETPVAKQNDAKLMDPAQKDPNAVSTYRFGPGPERGGQPTRQVVFTVVVGDHLVDCIVRRRADDQSKAHENFAAACMGVQLS